MYRRLRFLTLFAMVLKVDFWPFFTYGLERSVIFGSILNGLERILFMHILRLNGLERTRFWSIFGTFGGWS